MAELAQLFGAALRDLGREVEVIFDGLPERRPGTVNVIVAPHEFLHFADVDGVPPKRLQQAARASICITTEQPGTPWFDRQVQLCSESPLVMDIDHGSVEALVSQGIEAAHLQLGYHPSIDVVHGDQGITRPRSTDVTVLAAMTERRGRILARACQLLWERTCRLLLFTPRQPARDTDPHFLTSAAKFHHLANTKILLNIHQSDRPYFEWLRVIEAIANGCVVVTETSVGCNPLRPFVHFVEAEPSELAEYVVAALLDEDWRVGLARAAYDFLRSELDFVANVRSLLPRMESISVARPKARILEPAPDVLLTDGAGESDDRRRIQALLDERESQFRTMAKSLFLSHRSGMRQLEKIESAVHFGTDVYEETDATPAYSLVEPDVSVVVTNYNYGYLVTDAIDSVAASTGVIPEVIVVDDHSTDDSVEVLRTYLRQRPWLPATLVAKHSNLGLSAARNTGFEMARAPYVFVLDADNSVYPTGISRLYRALEQCGDDYAFAYGIIDCFEDTEGEEPLGLVSCLPWDVYRLTRGNYIDAMALVRRSAWKAIGGYDWTMDERFGGWEDFDMWLHFMSLGLLAEFVPSPVARYRVHGVSMLQSFNWAPQRAITELRVRYPGLPWPAEPVG